MTHEQMALALALERVDPAAAPQGWAPATWTRFHSGNWMPVVDACWRRAASSGHESITIRREAWATPTRWTCGASTWPTAYAAMVACGVDMDAAVDAYMTEAA